MKSAKAKVLHEILGRPMIAYLLDTLKEESVKDLVQAALKDYGVRFVVQKPQVGTGHAFFKRGVLEPDFPTRPREKSH